MSVSLRGFLQHLRSIPVSKLVSSSQTLRIVCGNESADFDSVASALSYAYFYYICNNGSNSAAPNVIVPVINIPRADLKLRRDIVHSLEQDYNVNEELLYFAEDIKALKTEQGEVLRVEAVIVDHNEVVNEAKKIIDSVVGIIDHHEDQHLYMNCEPRIVQTTGSCSSLVFKYWYDKIKDISAMKEMVMLSYGAVLLDTSNFKHKVEQPDLDVLNLYRESLRKENIDIDQKQYFKTLKKAKKDIKGLSVSDVLRKDYKQFEFNTATDNSCVKIGIASLVKPMSWLYKEYGGVIPFKQECAQFRDSLQLDILILMSSHSKKEEFMRELVMIPSQEYSALATQLITAIEGQLQLQEALGIAVANVASADYRAFDQLNVQASRKQVVPVVKTALESM